MMDRPFTQQQTALVAAAAFGSVVTASAFLLSSARSKMENVKKSKWDDRPLNQMFVDFPLGAGKAKLSNGDEVTVPYHIYDGYSSAVHGTCDLKAARKVCAKEPYQPVQTTSGRVLGLLSFWDFTDASLGPHTECQFTLLVTRRHSIDRDGNTVQNAPKIVPDKSFATLTTMIQSEDVYLLITELYNNTKRVVAYNKELLGLNAVQANTAYNKSTGHFKVATAHGKPIILAHLGNSRTTNHLGAVVQMMSQVGWSNMKQLAQAPYSTAKMASRVHGSLLPHSVQALSCIKCKNTSVQWYNPSKQSIGISKELSHTLPGMDFQGQVVFHYEGVEFCYLSPWDMTMTTRTSTSK